MPCLGTSRWLFPFKQGKSPITFNVLELTFKNQQRATIEIFLIIHDLSPVLKKKRISLLFNCFEHIFHLFFQYFNIKETPLNPIMQDEIRSYPVRKPQRLLVYPFSEILYLDERIDKKIDEGCEKNMVEIAQISKDSHLLSIKETNEDSNPIPSMIDNES